jgi:hypothetical protein
MKYSKNEIQSFDSEGVMNRQQVWKVAGVILLVCGLQLYGQQRASGEEAEAKAAIIIFDPPGSPIPSQTYPQAINPAGVITGYYYDAGGVPHGFLHTRNGFPSFDPKGSLATLAGPLGTTLYGSKAFGINPAGAITGYYYDAGGVPHCFLRSPDGSTFTNVDPTGSQGSNDQDPIVINPAGAIAGNYFDGNTGSTRGFVRASKPPNAFTAFDGSSQVGSNGTLPTAINPKGEITGWYQDGTNFYLTRGFLRDPFNGKITPIDALDLSVAPNERTMPTGINPAGVITGFYQQDTSGYFPPHGFLRTSTGTIISFDPPGSTSTFATAINPAGTVTGYYSANNANHGFLRTRGGKFTTFDGPAGSPSDLLPPSTQPSALNPAGEITGTYVTTDASFVSTTHGFLRIPAHQDE